jgi:hypothetical protein
MMRGRNMIPGRSVRCQGDLSDVEEICQMSRRSVSSPGSGSNCANDIALSYQVMPGPHVLHHFPSNCEYECDSV